MLALAVQPAGCAYRRDGTKNMKLIPWLAALFPWSTALLYRAGILRESPDKTPQVRFRFSMRVLLIVVTIVCVVVGLLCLICDQRQTSECQTSVGNRHGGARGQVVFCRFDDLLNDSSDAFAFQALDANADHRRR